MDGYTYHWYKGSDEVATGTSYNATTAGTYKVNATKDGCTSDFSNSITTSVTSITSTLAFTGTPYSGGTSSNIPVQVSATLNGASNLGYDWEIVSSTAAGAEIRSGTYSYQKNVYATGAGTVNIRCTMHVSKDGCTKDVVANTSVTVNSCSVSISSLSVAKWESSGKTCQNIPFAMVANYSVTPADATLTWQWKRGTSSSYLSNISSTYAKAGANKSKCYIIETSAGSTGTTYWYQVELTASKDGCSTTRTSSAVNVLVGRSQTSGSPTSTGASTSKAGTTLTFTAKSAHSYVIWSAIPSESYVEASNPSNLLWKYFSASSSSAGSGTATIPSSATGTIYYYNSKSSNATCPMSSGSYQGTSVTPKAF